MYNPKPFFMNDVPFSAGDVVEYSMESPICNIIYVVS
jgi:hypothetical protein